jgi:hypothetical protein
MGRWYKNYMITQVCSVFIHYFILLSIEKIQLSRNCVTNNIYDKRKGRKFLT